MSKIHKVGAVSANLDNHVQILIGIFLGCTEYIGRDHRGLELFASHIEIGLYQRYPLFAHFDILTDCGGVHSYIDRRAEDIRKIDATYGTQNAGWAVFIDVVGIAACRKRFCRFPSVWGCNTDTAVISMGRHGVHEGPNESALVCLVFECLLE